jgi:two-component system OmpR family sensor kinase/two-component system sensor histidine kinase BaeS
MMEGGWMDGMMGRGWSDGMMMDNEMWAMMGNRLVLADTSGAVVADTSGGLLSAQLRSSDLARGTPIVANGRQVGTLLVTTLDTPTAPVNSFVRSVGTSVVVGGILAGAVALVMGSLLFFQVTRPMRQLSRAAHGIAAGDLAQRVPLASDDEVGEVARSFNVMAESLQRMEQQRQNMVADIAHELRTPLSVIQSNVEAMLDGVLPASSEELESIHQETLLLNRLIGDLRTLSLAEAGQLALDKQPIDLGDVVARVGEKYHLRAEEHGAALSVEIEPRLPQVWADAARVEQVLVNLVENALCYGLSSGGRVTLGARVVPGGVEAWVNDTGPGIAPEDLPHVFERFWRSEKSRNRQTGGSGIGLALVKQLVEAHGGHVSVESTPGHGATFRIVLPAF